MKGDCILSWPLLLQMYQAFCRSNILQLFDVSGEVMVSAKRHFELTIYAILFSWCFTAAHANETQLETISGDWVHLETYGKNSWSCTLQYSSWTYTIDAGFVQLDGFGTASLLTIEASTILRGKKHWWYANDVVVPVKLGHREFEFKKLSWGDGSSELHLQGDQFSFLYAMSEFEDIQLLVKPNRWSEKVDWGKPIISIRQNGLKAALNVFHSCFLKHNN